MRAITATEEFKSHGLEEFVTVKHQDVCANGFGDHLINKADAVFLDLPHPWLAIPHAIKSLKETGGRICSFSPCIEQVQKSCLVFSKLGFQEIETMEVLQTQYNVQTKNTSVQMYKLRIPVINLDFVKTEKEDGKTVEKKERETVKTVTTIPPATMPGHTGYLTFATLPPVWARNIGIESNNDDGNVDE